MSTGGTTRYTGWWRPRHGRCRKLVEGTTQAETWALLLDKVQHFHEGKCRNGQPVVLQCLPDGRRPANAHR